MNPTISVIIPAYNSARTITEALDSVLAQSIQPHEILVVDDQSSDETLATIATWNQTSALPAITIPQSTNGGPAAARNAGISAATGSWIAFLDADDAWLPWHLATQLDLARQHPEALFFCGQTVDLTSCPDPDAIRPPTPAPPLTTIDLKTFVSHNPVATSTVLVQRTVLLEAGGFDTSFRGPEDYDLWLRIVARGNALLVQTPLSRYRTTVGSLSMDDRLFLPQVLRVLQKAFGPDGALAQHYRYRRRAFAEQYTAASWMAYNRGDRHAAIKLLLRSWLCGPTLLAKEQQDPLQRLKLLCRYAKPLDGEFPK